MYMLQPDAGFIIILMTGAPQANESHSPAFHSWKPYCFRDHVNRYRTEGETQMLAAYRGRAPSTAVHFHHNERSSMHCSDSSTSLGRPEHEKTQPNHWHGLRTFAFVQRSSRIVLSRNNRDCTIPYRHQLVPFALFSSRSFPPSRTVLVRKGHREPLVEPAERGKTEA